MKNPQLKDDGMCKCFKKGINAILWLTFMYKWTFVHNGRTHDNIIVNAMYMWNKIIKISFANLKHFLSFGVILFHLDLNNC
jgi:hypothetical protein